MSGNSATESLVSSSRIRSRSGSDHLRDAVRAAVHVEADLAGAIVRVQRADQVARLREARAVVQQARATLESVLSQVEVEGRRNSRARLRGL